MRAALALIPLLACGRIGFDARAGDGGAGDALGGNGTCVVSDVAVGRSHTCGIEGGNVWCWGRNDSGQANPATTDPFVLTPNKIVLPAPAVQVGVGRVFSCARLETGEVSCWGANDAGELGTGSMGGRSAPVMVALGTERAIDLAAGTYQACIRRASDQAAMCWGENDQFSAADPSGSPVLSPRLVPNTTGALDLGIGHKHGCVTVASGQVLCWGRNEYGQLASSTLGSRPDVLQANVPGTFTQVAAGGRHTCALDTAGDVRCWGKNEEGQLGSVPASSAHETAGPVVVSGVIDLQASTSGMCARRSDRSLVCWGDTTHGDGSATHSEQVRTSPLDGVEKLALGFYHQCVIQTGGKLSCWGQNSSGELGRDARSYAPTPTSVPLAATEIVIGNRTACAAISATEIRCWGANGTAQLGTGDRVGVFAPITLAHGLTGNVRFALGYFHGCAWNNTTVRCWGNNNFAEAAGNQADYYQLTPATIAGITTPVIVSVGSEHTCAIDGTVIRCWGRNHVGQLGNGTMTNSDTPVQVSGIASPSALVTSGIHSCAIASAKLSCWGHNGDGKIGDGTTTNRPTPVMLGLASVEQVGLGINHTCAIASGQVYCWGRNDTGQLGLGDTMMRTTPTPVTLPMPATMLVVSDDGACVKLSNNEIYCWGNNENGQFGTGTYASSFSPLHIAEFDGLDRLARSSEGGCLIRGTALSCWGRPELVANGNNSDLIPRPPSGCE